MTAVAAYSEPIHPSPGHLLLWGNGSLPQLERVSDKLAARLLAGERVLVAATAEHLVSMTERLRGGGVDSDRAVASGSLVLLDAGILATRLADAGPFAGELFQQLIATTVRNMAESGPGLTAYGEIVGVLWDRGMVTAALELESWWAELGNEVDFELTCGYPSESFASEADAFVEVCHLHGGALSPLGGEDSVMRVFPAERSSARELRRLVAQAAPVYLETDGSDVAQLVASELAANAIVHARTPFVGAVERLTGRRLRVSVADLSPALPLMRDATREAESGRGLALVSSLASSWGTQPWGGGKIVWAEVGPY